MVKIKTSKLIIDPKRPFENDALKRAPSGEILTQFILQIDEPYVIAIDSPWGTGKSTFLEMWRHDLKNQEIKAIYFNAWETDFNDEALIALIKEIEIYFMDELKEEDSKTKKAMAKIKENGAKLVSKGLPVALKILTHGVLDLSNTTESAISNLVQDLAKEQFNKYEESKQSLSEFKKSLADFSKEACGEKPLVFIIDELDRCRPDYAVQILEKVKHLFSTRNIVFVLGLDREQLGHSIRSLYGAEINVKGYLARFIDIDYHLPEPNIRDFVNFTLKRHGLDVYFADRKDVQAFQYDQEATVDALTEMFQRLDFTLREIEQLISRLTIVVKTSPSNAHLHPYLLCFLLTIKEKDKTLYQRLKKDVNTAEEILIELENNKDVDDFFKEKIRSYLEFTMANENGTQRETMIKYRQIQADESATTEERTNAGRILKQFNGLEQMRIKGNLISKLMERIEISNRFEQH